MRDSYLKSLSGGFTQADATEPLEQADFTSCSDSAQRSAEINAFYLTRMSY